MGRLGVVRAEAMYCCVPVVGTNQGGATEVVAHGETGLSAPFCDELAGAALRLLTDDEARAATGCADRNRLRQVFTQVRMLDECEARTASRRPARRQIRPPEGANRTLAIVNPTP